MDLTEFKNESAMVIGDFRDWYIEQLDLGPDEDIDFLDQAYIDGLNSAISLLLRLETDVSSV